VSLLATVGALLLAAALCVVALSGDSPSVIFLAFVVVTVVAPLPSAYMLHLSEFGTPGLPSRGGVIVAGAKWCILAALIGLIVFTVLQSSKPWETPILVPAVAGLATIAWGLRSLWRAESAEQSFPALDASIVVLLAVVVFAYSPFELWGVSHHIGFVRYVKDAPHFGTWLLVGVAWTLVGVWLRRREGWAFPNRTRLLERWALVAVGIFIVSLYDDSHFADFAHYSPLVGPAMHAVRGGIPMVDTYSQYGFLPFIVQAAAFVVFEPTFGTAAVVVRFIDLAYFAVVLAILWFVSRRRLSALWFLVPALLVQITTHNPGAQGMWNMHALPMTLGGRWLLPAGMALLLVATPARSPQARLSALVLLAVSSISSFEIFAFTLAPWGYCLLLDGIRTRSLTILLRQAALALVAVVAAHATMVVVIYLATGALVDYRPYLDAVLQHRPSDESDWSVPFAPRYALWVPIVCVYFMVLAIGSYRAIRGLAPVSTIDRLVPVVVWGIGPLAYFFGRPQEGTLNIACLSFAVVAIGIAEIVFIRPRRFGLGALALFAVMAAAFAFVIADGLEHFMRPYDPSRGNASFLRRCLSPQGCGPFDIPRNIALALHTQSLDPRTSVGLYIGGKRNGRARVEEAISMLQRLTPNEPYVGMLVDYYPYRYADADMAAGMNAFMTTGQWYAWGISSPANDGHSPLISRQILGRVAATPSGLPVIIAKDRTEWLPLNWEILQLLNSRCDLKLVETGEYHVAYRTENCKG